MDCEGTLESVCAFIFNLYLLVSTQVIRLAVKCEGNQNNETMVIQNKIVIPPLVLINCRGFFLLVPCNLSQLASGVLLYYVRRLAKKGPSLYFIYSLLYLERTVELLLFFFLKRKT